MKWTRPYADQLSYANMVKEVVTAMQPEEASAMKRDRSGGGIAIAKRVFPLVGMDERGKIGMRQRCSRGAVLPLMANLRPTTFQFMG
jgi:hypothetical protein